MDVNNLNENDVYQIFEDGISINYLELSSYYELSNNDTQRLLDYICTFLDNEVKVSYENFLEYLKDKKYNFIFGNNDTSFVFRCEVDSSNFEDNTFSSGGFHMAMPKNLTMLEIGEHVVFFGLSNEVSYRFCF